MKNVYLECASKCTGEYEEGLDKVGMYLACYRAVW